MSLFSERLRILRERKKKENSTWTQEFVADKIGVARVTYTAYEKGTKQPPMETVTNIANLLNTNTDYLHGLSDDDSPSNKIIKEYSMEETEKEKEIRKVKERMIKTIEEHKITSEEEAIILEKYHNRLFKE